MHELGLAKDIVRRALRESEEHQGAQVQALHVALGKGQPVDREALAFSITAASQGTPVEGAELRITDSTEDGVVLEAIQIVEA